MKSRALLAFATVATFAASSAFAATAYVGSWQVADGPSWKTTPTAYTGQEAAAFLFGGVAGDYYISTIDDSVANINHEAFYSTYGLSGGLAFAEDYKVTSGDNQYLSYGDASAYVWDNAQGPSYTNYAFRVTAVPEPETYAMLLVGLGALALAARRRA